LLNLFVNTPSKNGEDSKAIYHLGIALRARVLRYILFSKRIPLRPLIRPCRQISFAVPAPALPLSPFAGRAQEPAASGLPRLPYAALKANPSARLTPGTCLLPISMFAFCRIMQGKSPSRSRQGYINPIPWHLTTTRHAFYTSAIKKLKSV
jgi:hypothetical protein